MERRFLNSGSSSVQVREVGGSSTAQGSRTAARQIKLGWGCDARAACAFAPLVPWRTSKHTSTRSQACSSKGRRWGFSWVSDGSQRGNTRPPHRSPSKHAGRPRSCSSNTPGRACTCRDAPCTPQTSRFRRRPSRGRPGRSVRRRRAPPPAPGTGVPGKRSARSWSPDRAAERVGEPPRLPGELRREEASVARWRCTLTQDLVAESPYESGKWSARGATSLVLHALHAEPAAAEHCQVRNGASLMGSG